MIYSRLKDAVCADTELIRSSNLQVLTGAWGR